jgi:acetyltransferase-like isoleucine patch superfamily enzyme
MTTSASLFRRAWQPLKTVLSRLFGPRTVWGFVRGDGVYLPHTRVSNHSQIVSRERLDIGDHVYVGHFSALDASGGLSIGEGCQIGYFTGIFTHSSHVAIRLYAREYVHTERKQAYFEAPVSIGAFSFVGAHCLILPGAVIGRGSLVAAQSVVKGEFADFAFLAGNPAQVVGDTREIDEPWLQAHPELREHHEAWVSGTAKATSAAQALKS